MFGPIIVKAGSGIKHKTGSWRTVSKPKFLKKNCIACKMCVMICPEGCISGKEKNTFICDYNFCKGCGNCVAVCPKKDIIMISEDTT
ncbi:MAG: 4Fe-4S binding protein [Candidatus Omnitrophota bacterium]